MAKKKGLPAPGEFVVCKIKKINPHSAFAELVEFEKGPEYMIHISEVSSGWVKDIRKFLKEGQIVVAKVIRSHENVTLSIKRVDDIQQREKMKDFNLSVKAEKMFAIAAKTLKKTPEKAYKEAGYMMQENFGSLYNGFKMAMKNPDLLRKNNMPEEWIAVLKDVAEKSIQQKTFNFSAKLTIKTYKPDGINIIKETLKKMKESGLDVTYIAAPEYLVKYHSKNPKAGEKLFMQAINTALKNKDIESKIEML